MVNNSDETSLTICIRASDEHRINDTTTFGCIEWLFESLPIRREGHTAARLNYSTFIWIRCVTDESIREQIKQNSPRSHKCPKWPLLLRMHFLPLNTRRSSFLKRRKCRTWTGDFTPRLLCGAVSGVSRTVLNPMIDTIQLLFSGHSVSDCVCDS